LIAFEANGDFSMNNDEEQRLEMEAVIKEFRLKVRSNMLSMRQEALCDDDAVFKLARLLSDPPTLSYDEFKMRAAEAPPGLEKYFTATTFLTLARDEKGAIVSEDFLRYIQRSMDVESSMLALMQHATSDFSSLGFLSEQELERYLFDLIPDMPSCSSLHPSFYPYFVFTCCRRFFFFLDSRRTRRISIKKLAHSTVMEELLFLRRISQFEHDMDLAQFNAQISANWFSGANALRIYSLFIDLDKDQNGMLSVDELLAFTGSPVKESVQLTRLALERIFQENVTYQPMEMDYKLFLDLVLALENKQSVESLAYFWRILDLDKTGRLSPSNITYFYTDVYESLRASSYDAPLPANVVVEVFDILACNDPRGPTFADLVKSGQGHVVVSMLIDVTGFWTYDNRESLMQQPTSNGSGGSGGGGGEDEGERDETPSF